MERFREIVETINEQLLISAPINIQMSWGVSKKVGIMYENMCTLGIKVQGFLHNGWVYISYNEGLDEYEIRLMKLDSVGDKNQVLKLIKGVFFDEMGDVVDRLVERGYDSDEEYTQKVLKCYKVL